MDRGQSFGPDDAPTLGEETDVETASPRDAAAGEVGTLETEKDPLGGTGGDNAGGAG